MKLFRQVSRMVDSKLVKERVQLTDQEETNLRAEWAANEAQQKIDDTNRKRKKLIQHEKNKVINAQVTAQRTAIEKMDNAALDAALTDAGL